MSQEAVFSCLQLHVLVPYDVPLILPLDGRVCQARSGLLEHSVQLFVQPQSPILLIWEWYNWCLFDGC